MVSIPTTERRFTNTVSKVNTLGAYASALKPAAEEYKQTLLDQQKIKIDTNLTKARIELDNLNNQYRLNNQGKPDNPEAKLKLQQDMRNVLNKYGADIDPIAKLDWERSANKLTSGYEIANNDWAFKQRAENAKLDVAENINANLSLARSAGVRGDIGSAVADYANSYNQLYSYAAKNMGETGARQLLTDYEEQYMQSYINGLASVNPQAALEALKQPEIAASFKKEGAQDVMMKIVNKQIKMRDFQIKTNEFLTEQKLATKLDDLPTDEALQLLEENEGSVSSKFFKAKQKALLSDKGINAETRAETAAEIMLDIASLPTDSSEIEEYYKQTNNILAKIEDEYAVGYLSTTDKKRLINTIYKKQGANLQSLKSADSGWRFWDFSYKDADEFIKENYSGADGNKIMLDYFRKINDGGEYDNDQKKAVLQGLVEQNNNKELTVPSFDSMEAAKAAFEAGKIKKGDRVYIKGIKGTI